MNAHKKLILPLLATVLLAGCAGTPQEKQAEFDANGNKIEYVWYTPTGSSIPIKVRKDQLTQNDSTTTQTQNTMAERQRSGNRAPSDPNSGS